MAYVAVKGGTEAIAESIKRLTYERIQEHELLEIRDDYGNNARNG